MDLEAIMEYAEAQYAQYGSAPEHPWTTYPEYVVLRHQSGGKWYALVMNVPEERLGLRGAGIRWVLNVKSDPLYIQGLLQRKGFLPAYHMNKKNWISVLLDGTVLDEELTLPMPKGRGFLLH